MSKLESDFQKDLIKDLERIFPGALVLKGNSRYRQGVPDILVIWKDKWAALECKAHRTAIRQPNQDYYVGLMNRWSYASFVYPENKKEVLDEIQQAFGVGRKARGSEPEQVPLD